MGLITEEGKYCRKEWRSNKHDTNLDRRAYIDTCKSNYGNPQIEEDTDEEEGKTTFTYLIVGAVIIISIIIIVLKS